MRWPHWSSVKLRPARKFSFFLRQRAAKCAVVTLVAVLLLLAAATLTHHKNNGAPLWQGCDAHFHNDSEASDAHVFVTWLTNADSWTEHNSLALESLLVQHPYARVTVLASALPVDFFAYLTAAGYKVTVWPVSPSKLLRECGYLGENSARWLAKSKTFSKTPFFYSHFSDYLRFWALFRHGGLYMDLDAVILRPLPLHTQFVGTDCVEARANSSRSCIPCSELKVAWCLDGSLYLPPGVMRVEKGSAFLLRIVETAFSATYNPKCWNCVGPKAITEQYLEHVPEELELLSPHLLYPYSYKDSRALFQASQSPNAAALMLACNSLSVHLYGKMTKGLVAEEGSVMSILLAKYRLACSPSTRSVLISAPDAVPTPGTGLLRFHGPYSVHVKLPCEASSYPSFSNLSICTHASKGAFLFDGVDLAAPCKHGLGSINAVNRYLHGLAYAGNVADDLITLRLHGEFGAQQVRLRVISDSQVACPAVT